MASAIEPCPFCLSGHLHITQNGPSFCIVCQSCKSKGPHRNELENAIDQWNLTSRKVISLSAGAINNQPDLRSPSLRTGHH
ncbi:Lar family restriction alleviation protein [Marinimicrobium sp. ABcell2]|uniref:Lar family restriction alleviation protein n=1 Tax=Marinimicrobium sp. ABcell2 TaxID=3069751 RepID=UPI00359C886D